MSFAYINIQNMPNEREKACKLSTGILNIKEIYRIVSSEFVESGYKI